MSFILLGILNSQASAAGYASDYQLLETQVLSGTESTISFTGLSAYSDYDHLQIRYAARDNRTSYISSGFYVQFNGDTGSQYTAHIIYGDGSSFVSYADSGWIGQAYVIAGIAASTNATSNDFTGGYIDILDPFMTGKRTTLQGMSAAPNSINLHSFVWENTNALTSLNIIQGSSNQFVANTRFSLYGWKAA